MPLDVCPDCGGAGLHVNPEAPLLRDQRCDTCMGGGVVETPQSDRARRVTLAAEAVTLPFLWVRDLSWLGPSYAWTMLRSRWTELREDWAIDTSEIPASWTIPGAAIPEADAEWFARGPAVHDRAKLRQPSEPESPDDHQRPQCDP